MLNSELEHLNSKFPAGFQRNWDAHVYFDGESRDQALELRDLAIEAFKDLPVFISAVYDQLIGPHPKPMFEIDFGNIQFSQILFWLMQNRNGLDILVHQVTGDDPVDHFEGALWLGQTLKLDRSKLDPSPTRSN